MKNKHLILIALFSLFIFVHSSCKKETTIEVEKTITIYTTTDSSVVLDTFIGRPYQWNPVINNGIKKLIDIRSICTYCDDNVLDVYWGSGGTNWIRLPFVDNLKNVAVNYQWSGSTLFIFAYGDSATLSDKSYWDTLKFDLIKIHATIKK